MKDVQYVTFFSEQHHNLHIICIFKRKPVKIDKSLYFLQFWDFFWNSAFSRFVIGLQKKPLDGFWKFCVILLFYPKMCKNHHFYDSLYFLLFLTKFSNFGFWWYRRWCLKNLLDGFLKYCVLFEKQHNYYLIFFRLCRHFEYLVN